jgi:hypothetical protein
MLAPMPRVSRKAPGCLVFLIDQSSSMAQKFLGSEHTKAQAVAATINEVIYRLSLNCAPQGDVWDYYHLGAIGYGKTVELAFEGKLRGLGIIPISQVAENPRRMVTRTVEQDGESLEIKAPEWISPKTVGVTPMVTAITRAADLIGDWIEDFPDSVPPIVMNLSDGEPSDGDPSNAAHRLVSLKTSVGPTLLFNLQLTAARKTPVVYPSQPNEITDPFAKSLFDISSPMPGYLRSVAAGLGIDIADGARGFCANANMATLVDFLTIGSAPGNLR